MEKAIFRKVLTALAVTFTLLLFGTERAEAQTSSQLSGVYAVPQGSFVTSDVAQAILTEEIGNLKSSLGAEAPSSRTAGTTPAKKKYLYYSSMLGQIKGGKSVATAIADGLITFKNYKLPDAELQQLKQSAIQLLDN